jgi:ParB family chromosome partitioning protein
MSDDYLHVSRLEPNPYNRKIDPSSLRELANSITVHGVLEPLVVAPSARAPGVWTIACGERRWRAAMIAGLQEVPVEKRVLTGTLDLLALMAVENWQRENMNPMDLAELLGRMRDECHMSPTMIATKIGKSLSTVSYHLSLLELDDESRDRVRLRAVTAGAAHAAVKTARRSLRGRRPGRKVAVRAPHWSAEHPLADEARARCMAHPGQKYGGACGMCWEEAIREDERRRLGHHPHADTAPAQAGRP